MYQIIIISFILFLMLLFYFILKIALKIEDSNITRNILDSKIKTKKQQKFSYILVPLIKLPNYKKVIMEDKFKSLNIENLTAEEYTSEYIFKGIIGVLITLISFQMSKMLALPIGYIAMMMFFKEKNKLANSIKIRRLKAEEEAPYFIRFIKSKLLANNNDIINAFESYIYFAKYLKKDVEITVNDMNSISVDRDNIIFSLESLSYRLYTPIIDDFVSGTIRAYAGEDQSSFFEFLERDVQELSMKNLMRKTEIIKKKIKRRMLLLIGTLIIIVVAFFAVAIKVQFGL